jgi:hypothetical protein
MKISRTGLLPRKTNVRDSRLIVIATEGEKTEKQYFENLFDSPVIQVKILETPSDGKSDPGYVLQRLVTFQQDCDINGNDELWLMSDVDRWGPEKLKTVCRLANEAGISVAISNPCFELWLLLHFTEANLEDRNGKALKERLKEKLSGYNSAKLDLSLYTSENVALAVQRAKALDQNPVALWPEFPGTHVYKLAERLLPHFRLIQSKSNKVSHT